MLSSTIRFLEVAGQNAPCNSTFRSDYEYAIEYDFLISSSGVSRSLTPSCYLPGEKESPGIRLVCDVIMLSLQAGISKS